MSTRFPWSSRGRPYVRYVEGLRAPLERPQLTPSATVWPPSEPPLRSNRTNELEFQFCTDDAIGGRIVHKRKHCNRADKGHDFHVALPVLPEHAATKNAMISVSSTMPTFRQAPGYRGDQHWDDGCEYPSNTCKIPRLTHRHRYLTGCGATNKVQPARNGRPHCSQGSQSRGLNSGAAHTNMRGI
jgi:hypothetical protein